MYCKGLIWYIWDAQTQVTSFINRKSHMSHNKSAKLSDFPHSSNADCTQTTEAQMQIREVLPPTSMPTLNNEQ